MVEITIRDSQGYVSDLPPEAVDPLIAATSFRPSGFQFTRAYQFGKTDGRVKLFKHSKFPAGLVGAVTGALRMAGVPYHLEIERTTQDKPDLYGVRCVGVESRPYQDEAVEMAMLNARGVIRAPTGSGKTAIGTRVIAARGKHALVVVPTLDLLLQYKRFLEEHLFYYVEGCEGDGYRIPIGQLGNGVVEPQPVTVATVKTAAKAMGVAYQKYEYGEYDDKEQDTDVSPSKLRQWIQAIGTLLIDEAHILGAQTVYDVATKIPCPNKYGFSASPWRDDGADLMIEAATGPEIYRISTKTLVDDGYLVPPVIQVVNTAGWWPPAAWGQTCPTCGRQRPMTAKGPAKVCECGQRDRWRSEFGDAYREEIVENVIRNAKLAEIANNAPMNSDPTLVLVKQVKHGRLLEPMIRESRFLSGRDPGTERAQAYQDIRDGKLRVIIATTIADLGLDVPALTNLLLAGGGKSSTRHLQRIGRVVRTYEGKTFARVVDLDDSHVHKWFREHAKARRKIEKAEWAETAVWI